MTTIRLEKISYGYTQPLFKGISLSINKHDRIGIVGNNGSGKSSLLQCIGGILEPQEGRVLYPKGLKLGFIEQEVPKHLLEKTFYDVLTEAIPIEERSYSSWRVDNTLDSFQTPNSLRQKPIKALSGGWQRLALIARLVLSNPDVLLLDEPTNHLDISKIISLETWLNEQVYDIPLITISHDREFLDHCTNKTLFLRGQILHEYNYAYTRAVTLLQQDDLSSSAQREKELKEIARLKRSAHDLRQIGVNNYSAAALKKSIQIAKRAESIETKLTHTHTEEKRLIKINHSDIQNKRLIGLKNITICAPDGSKLFYIKELNIMTGDRLVIFGENGSGKSQFLNYLNAIHLKSLKTDKNNNEEIHIAPTIKLAYIDQHASHLITNESLHDYFNQVLCLGNQTTTSTLIAAGFPIAMQNTKLSSLSQGQRIRAAFLLLNLIKPNFCVLDEPTNHLDIAGQEQLQSALIEENATLVTVSHDRAFTKSVGTKFYQIKEGCLIEIASPEIFYNSLTAQ